MPTVENRWEMSTVMLPLVSVTRLQITNSQTTRRRRTRQA
jgi:hypothetical protein